MAASPDPRLKQVTLSDELLAQLDELVGIRYPTQGEALADLICLGLEKLQAEDPVTPAEKARAARALKAMGREVPKAATNGHATTAA